MYRKLIQNILELTFEGELKITNDVKTVSLRFQMDYTWTFKTGFL